MTVILECFIILHTQMDTVDLGYQADAPITLSGKKYALNKVYVLNKQTGNGVPLKQDKYSFTCTY